jgi:DNA-directed RNA polymerase sigma subunit (sigma70/sigma32)
MGVTRERARQIESQAMRRLRNNTQLRRALVELTGT